MMVQNAPSGEPRFICSMAEHNDLCGAFARAFGNDRFDRLDPFDEMVYVVGHHDRGWDDLDAAPALDPASGMPRGLGTAPVPGSTQTAQNSPDFNEKRHAFCGLLSSMHSWGLYKERYGYSEFRVRPGGSTSIPVPDQLKQETDAMLAAEIARQDRLKAALAADPETARWVEEPHLIKCYKQLQFFDTLALYFNLRHQDERGEEIYVHVPMTVDEDTSVRLNRVSGDTYSLDPFPFAGERLEVGCRGRYFEAVSELDEPAKLGEMLWQAPTSQQTYVLTAA
jgi:hypothetical protein